MMNGANFVTETNKAPLIEVMTLFLLSSAILCALCRLYTKWVVIQFATLDDYFVPVSAVRRHLDQQSAALMVLVMAALLNGTIDRRDDYERKRFRKAIR